MKHVKEIISDIRPTVFHDSDICFFTEIAMLRRSNITFTLTKNAIIRTLNNVK
jgi:hypothetical protein